jgi:signal transduction histidine kinase
MAPGSTRPHSLQVRFLLGLGLLMAVLGVIFAGSLYIHLQRLLRSEVSNQADLVLAQVDAVQSYVRGALRPRMLSLLPADQFVIEAMSTSFVSRQVMERLGDALPGHLYRRVSETPRNPKFQAEGMELELLAYFRDNPEAATWTGLRHLGEEELFIKARPVRFEASCLRCHGQPEDAPSEMLASYGRERGFHRQVGDLGGLDVVGVPVRLALASIKEATFWFALAFAVGILAVFGTIQVFFHRLVAVNLGRLSDFFHRTFREEAEPELLNRLRQGDEIEEVVAGMEALGRHLYDARRQLSEHAAGLELRVAERTGELKREAAERRQDVELFVRLLDSMSRSNTRPELLKMVLPRVAGRFGAAEAGYLCAFSGESYYAWPEGAVPPELPAELRSRLMDGLPSFEPQRALVPVSSQEVVQGVLCLGWPGPSGLSEMDRQVIMALARQLGIAMENLTALDNLLKQRDILSSVFEGVSDPMALLDEQGRVITTNQAGRSQAEEGDLLGLAWGGGAQTPRDLVGQALSQDGPVSWELDQGRRTLRLTLYPLSGPQGRRGRLVAWMRDITLERRVVADMQRSERLVAVGQLAAGLAHEINNPLGIILCYAELLETSLPDGQGRRDLEVIVRHTRQAQRVLKDLLDFARAGRGALTLVDLAETAGRALQVFAPQAEARKVRLRHGNGDGPVLVSADPNALEQILANLILNALDAVPSPGGEITMRVGTSPDESRAVLEIADNGPGVDPAHLEQIFDPFFTTKELDKGSGLGLAVVYGLARDMGGTITVENQGGAVFTLSLPLAQGESESEGDHA